jgi:hypothetical protein
MTMIAERALHEQVTAKEAAIAFLEHLAHAETLPVLVNSFGVEMPENIQTADRLTWLKGFTNEHLDFREGKERQQVEATELSPEQQSAIMATATELGMQGTTEAQKNHYAFVTVLGGANQSNLLRVRHAKAQMERGVTAPYMVLLGSARKLSDAEKKNVINYAPQAETEFDLLNAALEHEFGVNANDEHVIDMHKPGNLDATDAWKVRSYSLPNGTEVLSVSAPLNEGTGRPNTADTYRFMNEVVGRDMLEGQDVLNVTTDLYAPFQEPDALRLLGLPSGAIIETIGYGGIDRPASMYGQEINSVFNQAVLLQQALQDYREV